MKVNTCRKCYQEKPMNENYFHKNKGMKSGFVNTCKECIKKYNDSRLEERRKIRKVWLEKNKEHVKEYAKRRREENPEKVKAEFKRYYENNKDYFDEKARRYREENREVLREYNRKYSKKYRVENRESITKQRSEYYQKNKHKSAEARQRRTSREYNVPHTLTPKEWEETLLYFGNKDAYTGLEMKVTSQDHVIPVSKGGGYTKQNIIPCEINVNISKGNRDMEEWYREQDYFCGRRLKKIKSFMGVEKGVLQISML